MEPIISPWLIYWMGLVSTFSVATWLLGISCFVVFFSGLGMELANKQYGDSDKDYQMGMSLRKKFITPTIIFMFFAIFMPTKKTIVQMVVVKNITKSNVTAIVTAGKSVKEELKNDIIDIINAIDEVKTKSE